LHFVFSLNADLIMARTPMHQNTQTRQFKVNGQSHSPSILHVAAEIRAKLNRNDHGRARRVCSQTAGDGADRVRAAAHHVAHRTHATGGNAALTVQCSGQFGRGACTSCSRL